jgi:hypothetical protein
MQRFFSCLTAVRAIGRLCAIGLLALSTWLAVPHGSALALTSIKLFDLNYRECPPEVAAGAVTPGGTTSPAKCFIVYGKAENPTGKSVFDADIFGRIYDATDNSIMENRTRLGAIEEVPPGVSEFEFRISVSPNQPEPLKLEQFKAAGFTGRVRR